MSQSLSAIVLSRFRDAFGEPTSVMSSDTHWSLRHLSFQSPVNILVNGATAQPIVWIFDPHNPDHGVYSTTLQSESDIDPVIQRIKDQVMYGGLAGRKSRNSH